MHRSYFMALMLLAALSSGSVQAAESIWLEAEHLDGIQGYCWPLGKPTMKKTDGHWGLSGPGWAAEWNQGGESGFLSIATGADDDRAVATKQLEIPTAGNWFIWVRYGDWREKTERFQIRIEQERASPATLSYGLAPVVEEDNEMKLYFGWAFGWDQRQVALKKGPAKLSLLSTTKDPEARQIDVIVLTTDAAYRPLIKERPHNPAWDLLKDYRQGNVTGLEPLTRNRPEFKLPEAWKLKTFKDRGFLYLWNMTSGKPTNWLSDDAEKVLYPYTISDADVRAEFEKKYAGQKDVPIFSDKRIVPTFHGVGGGVFFTDPKNQNVGKALAALVGAGVLFTNLKTSSVDDGGVRFAKWLDEHPDQQWGMMTNYHPGKPIGEEGQKLFAKYRDRFVGEICGEALSSTYPKPDLLKAATENAKTRRQLAETFSPVLLDAVKERYQKIYGKDLDANAYADTISCLSVGNIVFAPLALDWGARTVGYESATASSSILGMRWAFIRGAARQHNALSATYRSCNFGDSATIFSITQSYTSPRNYLDNYYSVYSGAGMTWYKMDIWYQYMAGSSMFYHEQGHDEFWKPGGLTAAGVKEVQLSPKGQLVDRFLRVTAEHPDRGHPYTPAAILVDYAHGWEPSPYWPNSFKNFHQHPDRFRYGDHEKMLEEYFWTAYYPIGPESEKPITGVNEVYLPAAFGDIFDVIFAYPDVKKWRTIDTYPLVVAAGEIELTEAEGQRLNDYVQQGGTLVVADAHLTGPGAALLKLPASGPMAEAEAYRWLADKTEHASPRFRYRPIPLGKDDRALATTPSGDVFCAALDRGKGRLIYLSVPHGLAIGKQAVPAVARLLAHLSRGLMPIEVEGDVERLINRNQTGWVVTLMNPAGQAKPQQGITPTDYRENRKVTLRSAVPLSSAQDWLFPEEKLTIKPAGDRWEVELTVPAGGVRIIELND